MPGSRKKHDTTTTPKGIIRAALRAMWLRSRERATRLKIDEYTCQECGIKQSTAKGKEQKVEVHHLHGINWDEIINLIYKEILVRPELLETVCPKCHSAIEEEKRLKPTVQYGRKTAIRKTDIIPRKRRKIKYEE